MTTAPVELDEVVQLEFPARPEFVALARLVVSAMAATGTTFPDDRIDDFKLAVSEACTNAIEAQGAATEAPIVLRCWADDLALRVTVEDRGSGFDPGSLPERPPVTDPDRLRVERGFGIPIIRALVDELEISSSPEGTAVRMAMWLSGNGTAS